MKKEYFLFLLLFIIGCYNKSIDENKQKNDCAFDTILYILPERTEQIVFKEMSNKGWEDLNSCQILFSDTSITLSFSEMNSKNNKLVAGKLKSNRLLKIKNKYFPVYFLSDYLLSKPAKTKVYLVHVVHPKELSFVIDFECNLKRIIKSTEVIDQPR